MEGIKARLCEVEEGVAAHVHDEQAHAPRFALIDGRFAALRDDLTLVMQEEMARFIAQGADSQDALKRQLSEIRTIAVTSREDAEHRKARERHMDKQDEEMAELRHLLQVQTEIEARRQQALMEAERVEAEREAERRQHIAAVAAQTKAQTRALSDQMAAQNKQLGETVAKYGGPLVLAAMTYFLVGTNAVGQTRTVMLAVIVGVALIYFAAQMVHRAVLARQLRRLRHAAQSEDQDTTAMITAQKEETP